MDRPEDLFSLLEKIENKLGLYKEDTSLRIIPKNLQEYLTEYPKITQNGFENDHQPQFKVNPSNQKHLN